MTYITARGAVELCEKVGVYDTDEQVACWRLWMALEMASAGRRDAAQACLTRADFYRRRDEDEVIRVRSDALLRMIELSA